MAEKYSWSLLRVAVAQICQQLGWNSIHATPLELLTDVLERYLLQVARVTHRYAEQFGTSDPQLEDLALAFRHLGIEISELEEYISHIDSTPFAHEVLAYPAPKENNLQIPKSHSRELQHREEHIPDYLPLFYPEDELEETMVTGDASTATALPTPDRNTQECGTSTSDVSSVPGEKRPLSSPSDGMHFKRQRITYHPDLPTIAGHSQYEMRSVTMTHNGILTPTREGKLPDAKTPPPGHKDLKQESSAPKSSVRIIKLDFDKIPDDKEKMIPQEKSGKDKTNNSVACIIVHKEKRDKNSKSKSSGKKNLDKKSLESLKTVKVHKLPKTGRPKSPAKSAKVTVIRKEERKEVSLKDLLLSKDTKIAEQEKQRADVQIGKEPVSNNVDISSIQNSPIDLSMKTLNKMDVRGTEELGTMERDRKIEGEKNIYFIKEKLKDKRSREKEKVKEQDKGKENFPDELEDSPSEPRLVIAENVKGKLKDSEERVKARLAAIDDTIGSVIYQSIAKHSDSGKTPEAGEWQVTMKTKNTQEVEDWVTTNAPITVSTNDKIKKEKEPLTPIACAPDSIAASIDAVIHGFGSENEARVTPESEPLLSSGTSTVMSPTLSSPSLSPSKRGRKRGRGRSKGRGRGSPGCSSSPRGRRSPWGRGSPGAAVEDPIKASLEKQRSEELSVYDFPDSPEEGELLTQSHGVPVKILETQPKLTELPCGQSLIAPPPTGSMSSPTQEKIEVGREKIKVEPSEQHENKANGQDKEKSKDRTRTKDKEKRKEKKKKKKKDKDKEKDRKEKHKEEKKHKDVIDSPHPSFPILKIRFGASPSTPGHYSITSETKMSPHPESSPSQRSDTAIPKIVIKPLPPPPDKDREHKSQDMGKEEFHKESTPVPSTSKTSKSLKKRDREEVKKERKEREERKAQEREAQLEHEAKEKEAKDRLEQLEREARDRATKQEREAKEKAQLEQEAKERVEREKSEQLKKEAELERKKELERKLEEKKLQLERKEKKKEEKEVEKSEEMDTSQELRKENISSLDDEEETIPAQDGVFDNLTDDLEQAEKNQAEEQDIGSPEIGRKSSTELEFYESSSQFVPLIPPPQPPPPSQTKKAAKPRRPYKRRRSPRSSTRKLPKVVSSPVKKFTEQSGDITPSSVIEDQPVSPEMPSTSQSPSSSRMTPSPPQKTISNLSSVTSPHRSPHITPSPSTSKPQDSEGPPKTSSQSPTPSCSSTGEERKAATRGQVIPPMPPPSIQSKSKSMQRTVIVETVGSYLNASGEKIWICPACKMPDDGSPMIGCDVCDDWYHWPCVNIKVEPASEDQWFCPKCVRPSAKTQPKKRGRKKKKP
ncbi:hypothetical protein CHS0354_039328 [Potamilus streckersoni]|uniref:PHD-type domain-containing protein n=1 Tax=Potamilus streckersoni TaxID=2493646 RepID=A0AAE0W757_9BIVA|nr:hypothetical protein CHS0354_039328 [Potamilus streckersoni]